MEYISLSDIATYKQGKQVPIENQFLECKEGMKRFVRIIDFTNPSEPARYIEDLGKEYEVDEKCIIMIRYGSQTAGTVVRGISGIIANNMFQVCINDDRFDIDYMYYYLASPQIKNMLMSGQSSSTMPAITFGMMKQIQIPVRKLDEQKKIASLLEIIEKKIKTNESINRNLEEQGYILYKRFFIDNYKETWIKGTISDLGEVVGGSTPSKSISEYYCEKGIAWITPKDLSNNKSKFFERGEIDISELGLKKSSTKIMPAGSVLFSSRAPIGYIAIAKGYVTTNQGFKSIVPNSNIGTAYVYYFLKDNLVNIENMASGSTFKEISGAVMKSIEATIPDTVVLNEFNTICKPLFQQQELLEAENLSLNMLRDSLLPKLMSGELDVSELDI